VNAEAVVCKFCRNRLGDGLTPDQRFANAGREFVTGVKSDFTMLGKAMLWIIGGFVVLIILVALAN
jgi:hypothetical protein